MERTLRFSLGALACLAVTAGVARAQYIPGAAPGGTLGNPLFAQYVTPDGPNQATAGMYPAPHQVPWHVGNSWYTYQPLQPHEMMWQHRRNYYNYYAGPETYYRDPCGARSYPGGGGLNKTTVVWQSGCNHMGNLPGSMIPLARAHYAWAQRYYCIGGNCGGGVGGIGSHVRGAAGAVLHHGHGGCAGGGCGGTGGCATGDCGTYPAVGQLPYGVPQR